MVGEVVVLGVFVRASHEYSRQYDAERVLVGIVRVKVVLRVLFSFCSSFILCLYLCFTNFFVHPGER